MGRNDDGNEHAEGSDDDETEKKKEREKERESARAPSYKSRFRAVGVYYELALYRAQPLLCTCDREGGRSNFLPLFHLFSPGSR